MRASAATSFGISDCRVRITTRIGAVWAKSPRTLWIALFSVILPLKRGPYSMKSARSRVSPVAPTVRALHERDQLEVVVEDFA